MDKREVRKELEVLMRRGELYCIRHQEIVRPYIFYQKRCYVGRSEVTCPYLKIRGEDEDKKR